MPLVTNKRLRERDDPGEPSDERIAYELDPNDWDLQGLRRGAFGVRVGMGTRPGRWGPREDRRQSAVARKLGVNQAQVSRIENQVDPQLSTLEKYVEALGGRLELVAVFEDPYEPGRFCGHRLRRR